MSTYKFDELPNTESVASLTSFLISAWFLVAAGLMLAEPSVEQQQRAIASKTPVVTVRQVASYAEQPRVTIEVVAKRDSARLS